MQKRIILSIILSVVVILISLGIISHLYVKDSINRSLESRLALANIIGKYFDHILESNLTRLYDISISGKIDFGDSDWTPEKKALRTAYEYSIFTDRIFLLDLHGNEVLTYPHREGRKINLLSIPYVSRILMERKQVISDIYTVEPTNKKIILTLVPLKNKDGEFIGIAGGEINPTNYIFSQIFKSLPTEPGTHIDLIDSHGTTIASNDPMHIFTSSDHNEFLSNLIVNKKSAVGTCHRCHLHDGSHEERTEDMMAFAPLSVAPWGILIGEPQEIVFAPSTNLQKGFLTLGLIFLLTSLVLAIGMSRSIVRPIQFLIQATQRIGRGNLSEPVEINSRDEIGTLSQSFENMRLRLADSHDRIRKHNLELENRVAERTKELELSKRKLTKMLRQVISAQEEERKRIARELHDETSQSLAALGMSIDIAGMILEEGSLTHEGINELKQKLNHVLAGINLLIRDLRPPVLDDLGFESGIRWLLDRHMKEKGIKYLLTVDAKRDRVPDSRFEITLFRIIQEAIINITRHSNAKNVFIFLKVDASKTNLYIEDDGDGFDVNTMFDQISEDGRGLGLVGMKERASLINGDLSICSSPGKGTIITFNYGVKPKELYVVEDEGINCR